MCAETPQIASWIAHSIGLCRSIEPLRRHFDGVGPSPRDGVAAVDGATIRFETQGTSVASSVTKNGGSGVFAARGATVSVLGLPSLKTVISENGGAAVFADFGASMRVIDATISSVAGQLAVVAQDTSVLLVRDSAVSSLDQSAISAVDGSSATVRGSTVTSAASTGAGGMTWFARPTRSAA